MDSDIEMFKRSTDPPNTIYKIFYYPEGVTEFLGLGSSSYVGAVDETTVLKYPKDAGDEAALSRLDVEAQLLKAIGPHKHIVGFKGKRSDGLLLERARHGTVAEYLKENTPTWQQRFTWACQAAETVAATHRANVIHCDINMKNLLIDHNLTLKLCDFEGRLLRADGTSEKGGYVVENTKSYMPRADPDHADRKTDIFALGSAFYYIMLGYEPFPDLDSYQDEEQIVARFESHQFPEMDSPLMKHVTHKCWAGEYDSAETILQDLKSEDACPVHSEDM